MRSSYTGQRAVGGASIRAEPTYGVVVRGEPARPCSALVGVATMGIAVVWAAWSLGKLLDTAQGRRNRMLIGAHGVCDRGSMRGLSGVVPAVRASRRR